MCFVVSITLFFSYALENSKFFSSNIVSTCPNGVLRFTMIMAGQMPDSENLQAALGYGRVFYNVTIFMVLAGLCSYFGNVMPGCIGAGTGAMATLEP